MMYNNFWYYPLFPMSPYFSSDVTQKPPTLYAVLNSIVNGDKENEDDYTKIKDLAIYGRDTIFNFNYPLSDNVSRETFETNILNHFLMRRINFDTVTAFRIALCSKLNEIMPLYNKMFDAFENWSIFNDGEKTVRTGRDDRTTENTNTTNNTLTNNSTSNVSSTSDRRNSVTPQNQLEDVRNGTYVSNYNYDTTTNNGTDNSTSNGTSTGTTNGVDNKVYTETIEKTPSDKIKILKDFQDNLQSIYTLIYKDLDKLFYGIV